MQVCHGKDGPLRRIKCGDGVIYYSPAETMGGKDGLQSFTAIGTITDHAPYQHEDGGGFNPFRRNVAWLPAHITPIRPLLEQLELTRGQRNWGYAFRFGIVKISANDFAIIHSAMTNPAMTAAKAARGKAPPPGSACTSCCKSC